MSLLVKNIKIVESKIQKTPELDRIVKLMDKHGYPDGYSLLPTSTKYEVTFELANTFTAFANAIRRTLVEDIPVYAMNIEETDVLTDDEFISGMSDVLIKNIGLVPIDQDIKEQEEMYLNVFNNTTDIIDVFAKDIKIAHKSKKSHDDHGKPLTIIPDSRIVLARLRPGKYLKLRNITIVQGTAVEDAGQFSLLNNVTYKPLGMTPYDQFTKKGVHSYEHDCTSFQLGFTTCGNITPKELIASCCQVLTNELQDIKAKINLYVDAKAGLYFSAQDFEVTVDNSVTTYKFINHYVSELYMVAMASYVLDENTPFCSATVERYDSKVGLIKIKHADPNKLLLSAIDKCIKDLSILKAAF